MIQVPLDRQAGESAGPSQSPRPQPERRRLSMALVNFWLDALLLMAVVFVGWVTVTLQIVFPNPTAADGWLLWGLTFDQWRNLQFFSMCVAALVALVHVMMHWNWVCCVITAQVLRLKNRPDEGMQTIYGVGTMIVILNLVAAGVIAAMLCVKSAG